MKIGGLLVQKTKRKSIALTPGQIVICEFREDKLSKEDNKRRFSVIVEESSLFANGYPNVILVPITDDENISIPDLSVIINPTPENGFQKRNIIVSHLVSTTSKFCIEPTSYRVTPEELSEVRDQISLLLGIS